MTIAGLLPATRFRSLPRLWAGAILAGLIALIALGLIGGIARDTGMQHAPMPGDMNLYQRIIADVAAGQSYYAAVAKEHRAAGHPRYPMKPVFAVRTPLLASGLAALPNVQARVWAMRILTIALIIAWGWRLEREYKTWHLGSAGSAVLMGRIAFAVVGMEVMVLGVSPGWVEQGYAIHDVWAGELIALALALYNPRRWWISLAIGLFAACLRELTAPFLLAMGTVAWIEGRKREAAAWGVALCVFAAFIALHAYLLAPYVLPNDKVSPGWLGMAGWPRVLLNVKWHLLLVSAPAWFVALMVPLMLFGAAAWPGGLGLRLGLICWGYSLSFMVFGRTDDTFWGMMNTPLLALALLMAPFGLMDLGRSLFSRTQRL